MNNQEILIKVATHLLDQNETAMEDGNCKYHYNGLCCAIGCLIPDDRYDPKMEKKDAIQLFCAFPDLKDFLKLDDDVRNIALLEQLQQVHDCSPVGEWLENLDDVAKSFGLEVPKGIKRGRCNRTACQAPGALWFNSSTRAYYCEKCALLINKSEGQIICQSEDD